MFRRFLKDVRGNFAMITVIAMIPIMGGLALAVDYTELSRQRSSTMSALDAAGIATARRIAEGASDADVKAYAKEFFEANLGPVNPANTQLTVTLPNNNYGGGTLKGTSNAVSKTSHTTSNFTKALDEHMRAICSNAKGANVLMMTVALDLDATNSTDAKAITELKACASDSRFRKGSDGKPAKLFWNATGATLSTVFKEIADELSNLRIVG